MTDAPDDEPLTRAELEFIATWPNCSVPDCENKSCLAANSTMCHPHTFGKTPKPPEGPKLKEGLL